VAEHNLSVRRACAAVGLSRTSYYRGDELDATRDEPVIEALNALVTEHHRWGFWKCFDRLRNEGKPWNHKRVLRVYRKMRLNLPRLTKRRLPTREPQSLEVPAVMNESWSMDFMSDALYGGRRFRTLNILDEGVREALEIVIDTSIPAGRVIRVLEQLTSWRGFPRAIRCDNGPELISDALYEWCRDHGVALWYIDPGKPDQNAYIERFNRTYREEVPDAYIFSTLDQVRSITRNWLRIYNEVRPHDSLGGIPPSVFRRSLEEACLSTNELST
jgi:putative transposase